MVRPADPLDGATPSGASLIAEALLLAAHLAPAHRADVYASAAEATLAGAAAILARSPRSGGHWLAVAEAAVRGPIQIAVACDPVASELLAAARTLAPGRRGRRRRPGELLGAAGRPRPGGRGRRRLRVPRPDVRPAGHHRRGSRGRSGRVRVAFGACPTPEANAATVNRYLELAAQGSADDIAELYADGRHVEDPGRRRGAHRAPGDPRLLHGHPTAATTRTEVVTLRALGNEVAFFWALTIELGEAKMRIEHHQRDDVQRRRQDRVDEGLLGPRRTSPSSSAIASRRRRTTSRCSGRSRRPPCTRGRTRGGRTSSATGSAT